LLAPYCLSTTQYNYDHETGIFRVKAETAEDVIDTEEITKLLPEGRIWTELIVEGPFKTITMSAFAGAVDCKKITLPDTIKGINRYAFEQNKAIETFTLPKECAYVAAYAFQDCTSLKYFYYYKHCTNFSHGIFKFNTNLTEFARAENDTTEAASPNSFIGKYAFYDCQSLVKVVFPENCTEIGEEIFNGARSLTEITLPDGIDYIPNHCFEGCTSLITVNLENIISVGYKSFAACTKMESFTFTNTLKSAGDYAFTAMMALKDVSTLTSNPDFTFGAGAFQGCINLTTFTISAAQTSVPDYSFNECQKLKTFVMHDDVNKIGKQAFGNATIESIHIPKNLMEVGDRAFSRLMKLKEFTIDAECQNFGIENDFLYQKGNEKTIISYPQAKECNTLVIPQGYTNIASGAFAYCPFTSIVFEGSLVNVFKFAFAYCRNLTGKLVLPKDVIVFNDQCFMGCSKLNEVEVQNGTMSLAKECFSHCYSLSSIILPPSLQNLGESCFRSCSRLRKIDLKKANMLDNYCFSGCSSLIEVILPNNCKAFSDGLFSYCTSLRTIQISDVFQTFRQFCLNNAGITSITLPETVKRIEQYAFNGTQLTSIIFKSNIRYVATGILGYTKSLQTVEFYGPITLMRNYVFNHSKVEKILFHDSISTIAEKAFENTYLTSITYCSNKFVNGTALVGITHQPLVYTSTIYKEDTFAGAPIENKNVANCPPPRTPTPSISPRPTFTLAPSPTDIGIDKVSTKYLIIIGCSIAGVIIIAVVVTIFVVPCVMRRRGWAKKETLTESLLQQTV